MPQIGVADYGLMVWEGGVPDYEQRMMDVLDIGFAGLERMRPDTAAECLETAALIRRLGGDHATVLAPTVQQSIRWAAGLGKDYVWVQARDDDFDTFCRQVNVQTLAAAKYGIKAAYHFHKCSALPTEERFHRFMHQCPDVQLILDTANHFLADMDPFKLLQLYQNRLASVHLKDWISDPSSPQGGRTCVLGQGTLDFDLLAFLKTLLAEGYDKWIFVEPEHFQDNPLVELEQCRAFVSLAGI